MEDSEDEAIFKSLEEDCEDIVNSQILHDLEEAAAAAAPGPSHGASGSSRPPPTRVRWVKRDTVYRVVGRRVGPRPRAKKHSSASAPPTHSHPSVDDQTTSDLETASAELLLQDLQQSLAAFDEEEAGPSAPGASGDWSTRNTLFSERWRAKRPCLVNSMLAQEYVASNNCSQCGSNSAVIRCRDCLPCPYFCADCDVSRHKSNVLHNRDATVTGFFQPLPPTTCVVDTSLTHCGK